MRLLESVEVLDMIPEDKATEIICPIIFLKRVENFKLNLEY